MAKNPNSSIVLVGMMGSGKTLVGEKLARRLSLPFADSDTLIETEVNASIANIFTYQGEDYFRSKEAEIITQVLAGEKCVLSCGGGAFCQPAIRKLCKKHGVTIYLQNSVKNLWGRVQQKNDRPLAKRGYENFQALLESREHDYAQADITIACEGKSPTKILNEIIKQLA